jgi:hypothetical protein
MSWDKLVVAAPQGTTWPFDLDRAEAALRERFPDAILCRHTGAATRQTYVSFDVQIDGVPRHGIYVEGGNLTLSDGSPDDWADTIAWFLSLLPPGTPTVALAERNPDLASITSNASADEVREQFELLTTT